MGQEIGSKRVCRLLRYARTTIHQIQNVLYSWSEYRCLLTKRPPMDDWDCRVHERWSFIRCHTHFFKLNCTPEILTGFGWFLTNNQFCRNNLSSFIRSEGYWTLIMFRTAVALIFHSKHSFEHAQWWNWIEKLQI